MAPPFRRYTPVLEKHKGRYNARFYDPATRRRVTKSLGTSDKRIAMRRLLELTQAFDSGEFDPFGRDNYEFGVLTLDGAIDRYFLDKSHNRPATLDSMRKLLRLLVAEVPAGIAVEHVTAADVSAVVARCKSAAGKASYYRQLKAFFSHLEAENLIRVNPIRLVKAPRKPDGRLVYVQPHELGGLLKGQVNSDMFRRVRFTIATGLRLGEVCALRWSDIRRNPGRIYISETADFAPKAGAHVVPLFPYADQVLVEIETAHFEQFGTYPPADLEVFLPEHPSTVSHRFKAAVRGAGLSEDYSFHTLRHTFASWAVIAGVDLYRVSKWLGHASIKTTERYAHLSPEYGAVMTVPAEVAAIFGGIVTDRPANVFKLHG